MTAHGLPPRHTASSNADVAHVRRQPGRPQALRVQAALALPPGLGRAIATPLLATGHVLLRDPNLHVALAGILGAAGMELARQQSKMQRVTIAAMAIASPFALHMAVGATAMHLGIDLARVPMQAVIDTAMAAVAGTTVALMSSLMRPPWGSDTPAAIAGPVWPLIARFVGAAALGPLLFHTLMAAPVPSLVHTAARATALLVQPAFFILSHL